MGSSVLLMSLTAAYADPQAQLRVRTTVLSNDEAIAAGLTGLPKRADSLGVLEVNDVNDPCNTPSPTPSVTPDALTGAPIISTGNSGGGTVVSGPASPGASSNCPIRGANPIVNPSPSPTPTTIPGTPPPVPIAPLPSNNSANPVMQILNDINSGLALLSNVVNLANGVWSLIARGQPTEQMNFGFVTVMPPNFTPNTAWLQEQCTLVNKSFRSEIVDDSGNPVESFVWGVYLDADCAVNGTGSYIGEVTFDPKSFNAGYGSHLVVNGTIPSVYNAGTAADPIAAATLHLQISDSTLFNFRETSSDVLVTGQAMANDPDAGDKHFQLISKSSDGSAPEPISPY
jgi:hypothetical protein